VNLTLRSRFDFIGIHILPIPNYGDTTEHNLKYKGPVVGPNPDAVTAYAVVPDSPGFETMALRNAVEAIDFALRLIRAIGLPTLWGGRWKELGIGGSSPDTTWVISRHRNGPWDSALNESFRKPAASVEELVSNYSSHEISRLEKIYLDSRRSQIKERVLRAQYWLADATLPTDNSSRFARLSIAFETAIGSEASTESRTTEIGITQMLAERTAFLLGRDRETRLQLHKAVAELYGTRGKVMHGELDLIDNQRLARWAYLVWSIVREMLNRSGDFGTVDDLARWVRSQRYT